jgi:hypothetical protein
MPRKSKSNRPDFKVEIKDGKLTLQTRFKTLWKLWTLICMLVVFILVALALLQPEGWLDILRAILLLLEPALMIAAKKYGQLR